MIHCGCTHQLFVHHRLLCGVLRVVKRSWLASTVPSYLLRRNQCILCWTGPAVSVQRAATYVVGAGTSSQVHRGIQPAVALLEVSAVPLVTGAACEQLSRATPAARQLQAVLPGTFTHAASQGLTALVHGLGSRRLQAASRHKYWSSNSGYSSHSRRHQLTNSRPAYTRQC